MENVNIEAESQALPGWEILKTWHTARKLAKSHYNEESADSVDKVFSNVTFAETSEYKLKPGGKKGKDDKTIRMLSAHDKIKESGAEWVFGEAKKMKSGRRSVLCSVWKIIEITKKAGQDKACLSFLLQSVLVRSARTIIEDNCTLAMLQSHVLPVCKGVYFMIVACKNVFVYDKGSCDDDMIGSTLQQPWQWHVKFKDDNSRSSLVMPLKETGLKVVKFMERLHRGDEDHVIRELFKHTSFMKNTDIQRLQAEQFKLELLLEQYKIQRTLSEKSKDASAISDPDAHIDPADKSEGDDPKDPGTKDGASSEEDKETHISNERLKYARQCLAETVLLVVRPVTKEALKEIMKQQFISGRDKAESSRFGSNFVAVYCPGSDTLPVHHGRHNVLYTSPRSDETWVRMVFRVCMEHLTNPSDVYVIADCKTSANKDVMNKETKKLCQDTGDVLLNYRQADLEECGLRGRVVTSEHASLNFRGVFNVVASDRKHHKSTTTHTDSIINIHTNNKDWITGPKSCKEAIHGQCNLQDREQDLDAETAVWMFPWEKSIPLAEDLLQHAGANGLLLGSPGSGNWIIAAIQCKIKVMALTKNKAHQDFLVRLLEEWFILQSTKSTSPFFYSREAIIRKLMLPEDEGEAEDEQEEAEDEAEDEQEEEAAASEHEEEEDEDNDEEDEEEEEDEDDELFPIPKGKAKAKAKAKANANKKKNKKAHKGQPPPKKLKT